MGMTKITALRERIEFKKLLVRLTTDELWDLQQEYNKLTGTHIAREAKELERAHGK